MGKVSDKKKRALVTSLRCQLTDSTMPATVLEELLDRIMMGDKEAQRAKPIAELIRAYLIVGQYGVVVDQSVDRVLYEILNIHLEPAMKDNDLSDESLEEIIDTVDECCCSIMIM
jgi:hypothetical protein